MDALLQDLRFAIRSLRKSPGFGVVAVLTLALGIGANTALFRVVDAVLLRPLPVADPEELVLLRHTGAGSESDAFPYSSYAALRDRNRVFSGLLAYHPVSLNVSIDGAIHPLTEGQLVSGNYFATLGVGAILGRTLTSEDDRLPGAHPVCVISFSYWKRRFAGDPAVVGRTLHLSGVPFTVVGVTPPGFFGAEVGRAPDISVPLMMQAEVMPGVERIAERTQLNDWLRLMARLRPGETVQSALGGLEGVYTEVSRGLAARFATDDPKGMAPHLAAQRLRLEPGGRGWSPLREGFTRPLLVLLGFVGLILLVACANLASLLLVRAAGRRKELAVRMAVGASRGRLLRQLLTESLLLALLGAAASLLLTVWTTPLLTAVVRQGQSLQLDLQANWRIFFLALALALLTTALFGLMPALRASRFDLHARLQTQARTLPGGPDARLGRALVVGQVGLSVLLLAGAGLLVRSLTRLTEVNPGFRAEQVLVVRLQPVGSDRKSPELAVRYDQLLRQIRDIPGVRSASLTGASPLTREGWGIPGAPWRLRAPGGEVDASWVQVYPGVFATLSIPLLRGRDFGPDDTGRFSAQAGPVSRPAAAPVAVVNRSLVRRLFGEDDPVGRRFAVVGRGGDEEWVEVVGVVEDTRFDSLRESPAPMLFVPFAQANTGRGQMTLLVRSSGELRSVAAAVRRKVAALDPRAPPFDVETLQAQVEASIGRERMVAVLASLFGLLGLLLASVGLYGLMAHLVARRGGEIGLRLALGALPGEVFRQVLRDALLLVCVGVLVGVSLALAAGRGLTSLLHQLSPSDPVTLGLVAGVMLVTGLLAAYLPARRAGRVDPMVALRQE